MPPDRCRCVCGFPWFSTGIENRDSNSDLESGRPGDGGARTELTSPTVDPSQPQRLAPIPRVRGLLRGTSSNLFTPQTVVIGPYQVQEGSDLFLSRRVKDKAVEHIVGTARVDRKDLERVLNNLVNKVMPCYTHLPEDSMNSEKFSTMLLLDGCYLLCRLIKFRGPGGTCDGGGDVGGDIAIENAVVRDILYLFENQIPLCVLEAILNYIRGTENIHYAPQLIYPRVQYVLHKQHYISEQREPVPSTSTSTPSDLLHLVYSYFRRGPDYVPPGSAQARDATGMGRWRRVTEYHKQGDIRFRPRKFEEFQNGQKGTILDIDIQGGTLCIPPLQVDTNTMTMLRNLMALEEEEEEKRHVTAYCLFMSQVACTAEDVHLLQRAGILHNFMPNDEDAAKEFAYLCTGLAMDINSWQHNYLKSVWHDLDKRCSKPVHNFKGFFREKYCSTVFYRLVFFVVTLTFVSTVTQAIYAVIAYHKPPHS